MWLGCRSRVKKLIIYFFIFQFIYISSYVYANPAVAMVARPILSRVLSQVVAKRASLVAANDAVYARLATTQTFKAVGRIAANDAKFALGSTSTLRHAKDISWVHLALASGMITLSDLNIYENENIGIAFEPTAVKLADGRYAIEVNGETKIVNAEPTYNSPAIYKYVTKTSSVIDSDDVYISDHLNNSYRYYYQISRGDNAGSYAQHNSIETLAVFASVDVYGGENEEIIEEVNLDDRKYSYLYSKTEHLATYIRHNDIGSNVYATVKKEIVYTRLKHSFELITERISGTEEEPRLIRTFNKPSSDDYDVDRNVNSVTVYFYKNQDFIGDPVEAPKEQQLGSIADIDSGLFNTRPLTAEQIANMYNAMLLSASMQADYQGLPFNSTNPVTATEVRTALNELGLPNPSLSDLFAKAGIGDQIDLAVNSSPAPDIDISYPDSGENFDTEEGYSSPEYPELEMPTANEILDPFKQFFPTLQNFTLHGQSATCPTWTFDLWNKQFTIDSHCSLLEQQRSLIQLIFSIVWAFIALRHLLTA